MRRFMDALALVVIAPLIAEILPGSAPITQPGLLPFIVLIYRTPSNDRSDHTIYSPGKLDCAVLLKAETLRRERRLNIFFLMIGRRRVRR